MGIPFPVVRFGDALRVVQDNLDAKNYYAFNPAIDIRPPEQMRTAGRLPDRAAAAQAKQPEQKA